MTKSELNKKIGQRIVEVRKDKGWIQSDLARAMKKDRQAVEKLENGKVNPTAFTLFEVATALEVPLASILEIKF